MAFRFSAPGVSGAGEVDSSSDTGSVSDPIQRVLIPMKVDAFILNPRFCSGETTDAKIAPLFRPDYTGLRLSEKTIKSDLFPSVNLRSCTPFKLNRRITDIGNGMLRSNRCGVYLTWLMPAAYRSILTASASAVEWQKEALQRSGIPFPKDESRVDYSTLAVRPLPVRWLVVRHLLSDSSGMPTLEGWIVESDRQRSLQELVDANSDVDVDATPYMKGTRDSDGKLSFSYDDQADIFTGLKTEVAEWTELGENAPRVILNIISTGNEYFADFQPHNPNVFSILDNFSQVDDSGNVSQLARAEASFYVIGWHADATEDPFYVPDDVKITLGDRLKACHMEFKEGSTQATKDWSSKSCSTQTLCHGAIYNVKYSNWDLPSTVTVPANSSGKLLAEKMPISFGTTEMDALIAYVRAHSGENDQDSAVQEVIRNIIALEALLFAQDDGVDGQLEAEDEIQAHNNFDRMSGGGVFFLAGGQDDDPKSMPRQPTEHEKRQVRSLNALQADLDLCLRTLQQLRWDLFACWWKCVSDSRDSDLQSRVQTISGRITHLIITVINLRHKMSKICDDLYASLGRAPKMGALPTFYKPRDPTIVVGGVSSSWPYDFREDLLIRLDDQTVALSDKADDFTSDIESVLPSDLSDTIKKLLSEFMYLESDGTYGTSSDSWTLPLYHDTDKNSATLGQKRDLWNDRQPWFPLFVEWEAEYWHVPFELWRMETRVGLNGQTVTGYGIQPGVNLAELEAAQDDHDRRRISGRTSILPQVGPTLATKIEQLFRTTPVPVLDAILTAEQRKALVEKAKSLQFLGFPLAGITDHLLTRSRGTHSTPNFRFAGEMLQAIPEAILASSGLNEEQLMQMGDETTATPYSSLFDLSALKFSAFKPCTHGQLRFTKFNIIDRFGQGIHALNPDAAHDSEPPQLFPCVSEFYACQPLDDDPGVPNTVLETKPGEGCQFVQLPPQINQFARLNGCFVTKDDDSPPYPAPDASYWRPCEEWENPVWGWVLVNMVNEALQLFLADGTFYCEVRLAGPIGSQVEPRWLPFQPSTTASAAETGQMENLIAALQNKDYLEAFITMIQQALDCTAPVPWTYSNSLVSSIGRPLALVYTGWSIELAVDALVNESSLNPYEPDLLLNPGPESVPRAYSFPLKLGDGERSYDGLIGYFDMEVEEKVDFDTIYTYFPADSSTPGNPTEAIDDGTYDSLYPFYIPPDDPQTYEAVPPEMLFRLRNRKMTTYAVLMDPFVAVHGYTGILPSYALRLPDWSWRRALDRITTFIAAGPLVTASDVPAFDKDYVLGDQSQISTLPVQSASDMVAVPTPLGGDWAWLQPYAVPKSEVDGGESAELETAFMALEVRTSDARPHFEPGPYTALEGYLMLKKKLDTS